VEFPACKTKSLAILAPMAGITDGAFRKIAKNFGAGLTYTEMISAKALCYQDKKTRNLLDIEKEQGKVVVQLFGSDPETMAQASRIAASFGASGIDLNFGCPTPKIVKNGDGAALLKNLPLAGKIIESVVKACPLPVSVKCRTGWDRESKNVLEFAKNRPECRRFGHLRPRTHPERTFTVPGVDLQAIKEVKEAVSIPVIGNGDVDSPQKAKEMLEKCACDFVMIGRAAWGNPWIFAKTNEYLKTACREKTPTFTKGRGVAIPISRKRRKKKGERTAALAARKHMLAI
jgi:tRNA-dihydrouridine synthase B